MGGAAGRDRRSISHGSSSVRRALRLLLLNPNTNPDTTRSMLAIAQAAAPAGTVLDSATAATGALLITTPGTLAAVATAIVSAVRNMDTAGYDGVIVAAFGDPGLDDLRRLLPQPVTGIAEAGMAEAASLGPFTVVTTTPNLVDAITAAALRYGHAALFRGVRVTPGVPEEVMADAERLHAALLAECWNAVRLDGAAGVVIGGGPLAVAARALGLVLPLPVIEPVPAAVRLAAARAYRGPLVG